MPKCTKGASKEINKLREMRELVDEVTTSDLQGIAQAKAHAITGITPKATFKSKTKFREVMDVENTILEYAYGKLDFEDIKSLLDKYSCR